MRASEMAVIPNGDQLLRGNIQIQIQIGLRVALDFCFLFTTQP